MKEIILTKEEKKGIENVLTGCECYIVLSNKGKVIQGTMPDIMSMITALLGDLYKENRIDDKILEDMINIIKKPEDVNKMVLEKIKKMLEKISGGEFNVE